jgi:hypothetical protein
LFLGAFVKYKTNNVRKNVGLSNYLFECTKACNILHSQGLITSYASKDMKKEERKRGFFLHEKAVSEVFGALLIIGILISTSSIYFSRQIPEWTKDYESRHIEDVVYDFAEFDSLIDGIVLVAKQGGNITGAAGNVPIKMSPDRVPLLGMSPPGSVLSFKPQAWEVFEILPWVGAPPGPFSICNFTIEENTTSDFSDPNATRVNVDVTFDSIKLAHMSIQGDLSLNNTVTTLSGEYQYDTVTITNNSIVYLVPGYYLKIYANSIFLDATASIIADDRGYLGGDGGKIGGGPGAGSCGYYGSGGGGAGYGSTGGDGGLGGYAVDYGTANDEGMGGVSYGDSLPLSFDFGSGGGGGGYGEGSTGTPHQGTVGGDGGNGGGAVFMDAPQIRLDGVISAEGSDGASGAKAATASGGGGGGSGGTIVIRGYDVNLSSATLSAKGGTGGDGGEGANSYKGGGGGGGSGGRIKIFYEDSAYTTPSYSVAGGAGGLDNHGKGTSGENGEPGNNGVFYDEQTTHISSVPHYSFGYYVSKVYDTGNATTCYGNITWSATTDEYTPLVIKVRTGGSTSMAGASLWENCPAVSNGQDVSELSSAFDGHRYIQYRVELTTYDATTTPVLHWMHINYSSGNLDAADGSPIVDSSSGTITFNSAYLYYPNQELVYEHGAVIKTQKGGGKRIGFILHEPPITIVPDAVTGKPSIQISMINLIGSNYSYAGGITSSIEMSYNDHASTADTVTFDNLGLKIGTVCPSIWGKWFNETLEESGLDDSYYSVMVNETANTVVVELYGNGDGVKLYEDKTAIKVKINQ